MDTDLTVSEARDHFSEAVNRAAYGGRITHVTRGRSHSRAAAIVPAGLLVELEELRHERDRTRTRALIDADVRGEVDWITYHAGNTADLYRGLNDALELPE